MPSGRFDEARDYAFGDRALALRKRASLTQRELAALLHVNVQSIHGWENGLFYPDAAHLQRLIALYRERDVLAAGREEAEAQELWELVRAKAARRTAPFDRAWFATLQARGDGAGRAPSLPRPDASSLSRHDWGEAPAAPLVQGRTTELALLARWVDEEGCRVVQVLGPGGIGKTTLAARLAQELAPTFPVVYWRSLRNAPLPEEWLAGAIAALSAGQALPPEGLAARLGLLLELLRAGRALLVLDNLETVLAPAEPLVRYRAGYEGYGEVLARLGASAHQGCVVLTSREQPLRSDEAAVRALLLGGLGVEEGRALLGRRDLVGDAASWQALVERYAGNPLALGVVGETIKVVFGGDIAAFLAQEATVFGGIRQLLDEQLTRLSTLEHAAALWLAVEREPVGFGELVADLGPGATQGSVVEAVEALGRRSLLERGGHGTVTLQPVVLEYVSERLVAAVAQEIAAKESGLLISHSVVQATAKDYVRQSQERLLAQPLLEDLSSHLGGAAAVERRLLELLDAWRGRAVGEQGYGPGNVVNLLRLLRGALRGLDLARLSIRQAYLAEVEAQDATLAGAHLAQAILAEAFNYPTAVALSADGALLAAGTDMGEVCLWRVADRTPLLTVHGHGGLVLGLALSGDGGLLASSSEDGTVKLWAAESGQLLATLEGHTGAVFGVALSGDGQLAASGSEDGTVRLWAAPSGQLLATLQGHTGVVRGVALSGDGRLLASAGLDGTVRLWAAPSGQLLATLQGHSGGIYRVALSADGQRVASGSFDGTVRLWEVPGGQLLAMLQGHSIGVWGVALSGDGQVLASGSIGGTVKLWEASSGRLVTTLQGHSGVVWGVALSGDGQVVASGSQDGTVRLWAAPSGRPLATVHGHAGAVWGVALSGDGQLVASSGFDGTVKLWAAPSGRLLTTLQGHTGAVWRVALSGDGRLGASGGVDGTVRLWAAPSGQLLATLQGHTGGVWDVALSADGQRVASASSDGTVRLWEVPGGHLLATLASHTGVVHGVALAGDGRLVASGSEDGTVRLWETGSGRPLTTLQGHTGVVFGVALSGDGQLVASAGLDGTVRLWATPSGRLLATLQGHIGGIYRVALSADGRLLASSGFDGTVRLWAAPSGRLLATLHGHTSAVQGVALSGDGQVVASASVDGTVRLWEAGSGTCLRTLRAERRYERLDITGLTGITAAQRAALLALGAVEQAAVPAGAGRVVLPAPASHRLSRTERLAWTVEYLRTVGALSPRAYATTLAVSVDTALLDLRALVDTGLVRAEGTTKNRRYVLADHDQP